MSQTHKWERAQRSLAHWLLVCLVSYPLFFFLVAVVVCMRQGCMHVEVRGVALLLPPFSGIWGSVSAVRLGLHSKHICLPASPQPLQSTLLCWNAKSYVAEFQENPTQQAGSSLFGNQWFKHEVDGAARGTVSGCPWKPCCLYQCLLSSHLLCQMQECVLCAGLVSSIHWAQPCEVTPLTCPF